jgi:hypothetical protein
LAGEVGYGPHDHMHRPKAMHPGHGRSGAPSRQSDACRSRCAMNVCEYFRRGRVVVR